MKRRIITFDRTTAIAPNGEDNVAYSEELVAHFLGEFTQPGNLVFDPFAGFGTTLVVAERMGRRALGVELLPERVAFIRSRLRDLAAIIEGDALRLEELSLPPLDFVMTSPPYMTKVAHPQNPLTAYQTLDGDYGTYIEQIAAVVGEIARVSRPGGRMVLNVANLRSDGHETLLATDVSRAVERVMLLEEEVRIEGPVGEESIRENYCYVFANFALR